MLSSRGRKVVESKKEGHHLELSRQTPDGHTVWVRVDLKFTWESYPAELIIMSRLDNKIIRMPIESSTYVYRLLAAERIFHVQSATETLELRADDSKTADIWLQTLRQSIQQFAEDDSPSKASNKAKKKKEKQEKQEK